MKSGQQPDTVYFDLFKLGVKDISMEVVSNTSKGMIEEADRLISKFHDVVTIKVPCTREGLIACKQLSDRGIRVNVTFDIQCLTSDSISESGCNIHFTIRRSCR